MQSFKGMRSRLVLVLLVGIACLTVASHVWIIPLLHYPLLPGVMVHTVMAGDSLRGATDAHGGTAGEERLAFVVELLTNLGVYLLLAVAIGRVRLQSWNSK